MRWDRFHSLPEGLEFARCLRGILPAAQMGIAVLYTGVLWRSTLKYTWNPVVPFTANILCSEQHKCYLADRYKRSLPA